MANNNMSGIVEQLQKEYTNIDLLQQQAQRLAIIPFSVNKYSSKDPFWKEISELKTELMNCYKLGFPVSTVMLCRAICENVLINELAKILSKMGPLQIRDKKGTTKIVNNIGELRAKQMEELIRFALTYKLATRKIENYFRTIQYLGNQYTHNKIDMLDWDQQAQGLYLRINLGGKDKQVLVPYDDPNQDKWAAKLISGEFVPRYVVKITFDICNYYYGSKV